MNSYLSYALLILNIMMFSAFAGNTGTVKVNYMDPSREAFQEDEAEIYVAFIGARPLDEVVNDLQPQFDITPQSALQMAVPNTQNSAESTLSSISTALQLGLLFSTSPTAPAVTNLPQAQPQIANLLTN